jgi:predicted DNA-binding antitoxin AbrB/MazE fold protein
MSRTVEAIFDGEVLRPEEPLELKANTRVRITVEERPSPDLKRRSFLKTARSLNLDGPPDWSERIEDYLYGNPNDSHE